MLQALRPRRTGTFLVAIGLATGLVPACRADRADARTIPHPDDATRQVEYYLAEPTGKPPWPTVVLLHGHQDARGPLGLPGFVLGRTPGGRQFADWGVLAAMARRGYLAVAISQPGYGESSGPADFAGSFTSRAVAGVLERLRIEGRIAPGRLLLEGISRGAIVAGLTAARDSTVAGLVLVSGAYDLVAYSGDSGAGPAHQAVVDALRRESGGTKAELEARSVLPRAARIRAATLVLHGSRDDRTSAAQAQAFGEAIARAGGQVRVIVYPAYGHQIPVAERAAVVDPFIDSVLRTRPR